MITIRIQTMVMRFLLCSLCAEVPGWPLVQRSGDSSGTTRRLQLKNNPRSEQGPGAGQP